jgi:hypothetical protein
MAAKTHPADATLGHPLSDCAAKRVKEGKTIFRPSMQHSRREGQTGVSLVGVSRGRRSNLNLKNQA